MKLIFMSPKDLKPYEQNVKAHPPEQIEEIARIIARDGFDQPIVVDGDHVIIKGHGRTLASLLLELDEVPVVVRDDLDAKEVALSRLVDNESVDTEWDLLSLSMDLSGITDKLSGALFSEDEVDSMLNLGQGQQVNSVAIKLSDMPVNHKCPHCEYEW